MFKIATLTAALVAAFTTSAFADKLNTHWDDPVVTPPPQAALSWSGVYGGVGFTTQKKDRSFTQAVSDGYTRTCTSGGTGHSDQKCQVSRYDWENSPEIQELRDVRSPWRVTGLKNDGQPGEIVRYDNAGYPGIWLNDQQSFTYTTTSREEPSGSRGATLESVEDAFRDIFVLDEDREFAVNAFVGYRHVFKSGFAAGLEAGLEGGAEAQIGVSKGRVFAYTGYNTSEETTVGADVLIGKKGRWFLGAKGAFGDDSRGELRIGFHF